MSVTDPFDKEMMDDTIDPIAAATTPDVKN
jgi:hypothetical protein